MPRTIVRTSPERSDSVAGRRVRPDDGWLRAAWDLLTFATGPQPATGANPTSVTDRTLEQLMVDHADAVYRVALSVTRNPHLAEDVAQDALLKAWQALPTFRGESPLRNWILRITHNTAISTLRKRRDVLQDPFELPENQSSQTGGSPAFTPRA